MSNIFDRENIGNRQIERSGGNMEFHIGDEVEAGLYKPPAVGIVEKVLIKPDGNINKSGLYTVRFDGKGIFYGQTVRRDFNGTDLKIVKTVKAKEKIAESRDKPKLEPSKYCVGQKVTLEGYSQDSVGSIEKVYRSTVNPSIWLYQVKFEGKDVFTGTHNILTEYEDKIRLCDSNKQLDETPKEPEEKVEVSKPRPGIEAVAMVAIRRFFRETQMDSFSYQGFVEFIGKTAKRWTKDDITSVLLSLVADEKLKFTDKFTYAKGPKFDLVEDYVEEKKEEYRPFRIHDLVKIKATESVGKIVGFIRVNGVFTYQVALNVNGSQKVFGFHRTEIELYQESKWDGRSASEESETTFDERNGYQKTKPEEGKEDNPFLVVEEFIDTFKKNAPAIGLQILNVMDNFKKKI